MLSKIVGSSWLTSCAVFCLAIEKSTFEVPRKRSSGHILRHWKLHVPVSDYPTSVLEGEQQKSDRFRWNLALDLCASFDKKTSSHRPVVILYGEKRVTVWVVARSLWISYRDILKYRSTSRMKNRLHAAWTPIEEASVLLIMTMTKLKLKTFLPVLIRT